MNLFKQDSTTLKVNKEENVDFYLTLLAQYWQLGPCQPSRHRQLPLTQFPLTQLPRSQVEALATARLVLELAPVALWSKAVQTKTRQRSKIEFLRPAQTNTCFLSSSDSSSSSSSLFRRSLFSPPRGSLLTAFRRYLLLNRNKNICAASAILVVFHVSTLDTMADDEDVVC